MDLRPERPEIDHRTIKLLVAIVAFGLAPVTSGLTAGRIGSISESYHVGWPAQSIFIASVAAVGALMLAYNGRSTPERLLSKLSAVAAIVVALFPCDCGQSQEGIPGVHGTAAAVLFAGLTALCWQFSHHALAGGHVEGRRRAGIYLLCGLVMVASVGTLAADHLLAGSLSVRVPRLVFYGERAALNAFGLAWLTASGVLPWLSGETERYRPWRPEPAEAASAAAVPPPTHGSDRQTPP